MNSLSDEADWQIQAIDMTLRKHLPKSSLYMKMRRPLYLRIASTPTKISNRELNE